MFGDKDKSAKPVEKRKCPFYTIGGSTASSCLRDGCAMWRDEAEACAFNVLARAAEEGRH